MSANKHSTFSILKFPSRGVIVESGVGFIYDAAVKLKRHCCSVIDNWHQQQIY